MTYKRWGHLGFLERENLRKREGGDLEKKGMTLLINYAHVRVYRIKTPKNQLIEIVPKRF